MSSTHLQLAQNIADLFAALPQVEAVALGGSRGKGPGTSDSASDIDLYVYTHGDIPLELRREFVEKAGGAARADLNLNYWGLGDEWLHAPTGIEVDVNYFDTSWMEEQVTRVMDRHQPSLGYTTCFCYTVHQSGVFYDPHAWFARLQQQCRVDYPQSLRQNIIAFNYPVLRGNIPAYAHQIEKAVKRLDMVSLNHRLAALLASYFDIVFALNRQLHPGEKRQVEFALNNCAVLPSNMDADINAILLTTAAEVPDLPKRITRLLDHLDQTLKAEGFGVELSI